MKVLVLAERPSSASGGPYRLGRHVEHHPESRGFATIAPHSAIRTVKHVRHCPPYQQGDVGSCTGNAMAGALMTGPLFVAGRQLTERDAVRLYERATHLDNISGSYPPDDTGSSGIAVAKAAMQEKLITSYHHAFSLNDALAALTEGPVIVGTDWFDGFDTPVGPNAELVVSGPVRGGHEYVLDALNLEERWVHMTQSWGPTWGLHGGAILSFDTLATLLARDGDVVVPRK